MPKSKGSKHFQKDSLYEKYDMNKDGIIDDEELETITAIQQEEMPIKNYQYHRKKKVILIVCEMKY